MNEFMQEWGTVILWTQIAFNTALAFWNLRTAKRNWQAQRVASRLKGNKETDLAIKVALDMSAVDAAFEKMQKQFDAAMGFGKKKR